MASHSSHEASEGNNLLVGDHVLEILGGAVQRHALDSLHRDVKCTDKECARLGTWAVSLVFLKWTLRLEPLALALLVALSGSMAYRPMLLLSVTRLTHF